MASRMKRRFWSVLIALVIAGVAPALGQNVAPRTARTSDVKPNGNKPNLTGLWQSLGTADWDIQAHGAQAGPFYQLGAIGAIPPGQGIVVGDEIPYLPAA